jgi:hypothetical protein
MRHSKNSMYPFKRLRKVPPPVLTVRCGMCPDRLGRYVVSSLIDQHSPDALVDVVLDTLIRCKWRRKRCSSPPQKYHRKCHAHIEELET